MIPTVSKSQRPHPRDPGTVKELLSHYGDTKAGNSLCNSRLGGHRISKDSDLLFAIYQFLNISYFALQLIIHMAMLCFPGRFSHSKLWVCTDAMFLSPTWDEGSRVHKIWPYSEMQMRCTGAAHRRGEARQGRLWFYTCSLAILCYAQKW